MFDAATSRLLRSAPAVPGLDPDDLPALLTNHFASLASARLRGVQTPEVDEAEEWSLERIADTYELVTSLHQGREYRAASAFVAGTAQQLIARRQAVAASVDAVLPPNLDRDHVDPALAAAILFLAAEQYADANEAAAAIRLEREGQLYEAIILGENIIDLAEGRLTRIVERATRWRHARRYASLEERALAALLETLTTGIEVLAAQFLRINLPDAAAGRFDTPQQAFRRVLELAASTVEAEADFGADIVLTFAGPYHLASLLLAAADGIVGAALMAVPPPAGSDPDAWERWLRFRAEKFPYLWPNHRDAIEQGFHATNVSSVVVLPTGAGKTTVSSLKIAGVLARGKKVVFLAPTHALVDQLAEDLQKMFPKELLGSVVSSDFDLLFLEEATFHDIEVMTPERCLAMISFAPESFADVGLLVFDECHLLSPQSGKIRRALDGMLCVLGFCHIAKDADLLFLSAMLNNGEELAQWLGNLTGRPSIAVDLVWKPSRQARGVIIYDDEELRNATSAAVLAQRQENARKGKAATTLRKVAAEKLLAIPLAIWGLQHNWLSEEAALCSIRPVLNDPVLLAGDWRGGSIHLTPNANQVAVRLAAAAAGNGLKTIVFVNAKLDAVGVAEDVSALLEDTVVFSEHEQERWDALGIELGGHQHALLSGPAAAVPHNSAMLRLERDLAERLFKRQDGAKVIVATPTLAQGLNLPAHLAILAGDRRADIVKGGREDLEAHEILNAAARAGRAGHLANGLVLMIPEPLITFEPDAPLSVNVIDKLKSILPEDDHCVTITDPLEVVLDRLTVGATSDPDVRYMINRMAVLRDAEDAEEPSQLFDLRKSLGAYAASRRAGQDEFEQKVNALRKAIADQSTGEIEETIAILASRSGLSTSLLIALRDKLKNEIGTLPVTVDGWLTWTMVWLSQDEVARSWLLQDVRGNILTVCGKKKNAELHPDDLVHVLKGLHAWVRGEPLNSIEIALGGDPTTAAPTKRMCPRARELVGNIIPRGVSFILGLIAHVVTDIDPFEQQKNLDRQLVESLSNAVRKGFDSTDKLFFANSRPAILSRVQAHRAWLEESPPSG
jgi:hypothetical protein